MDRVIRSTSCIVVVSVLMCSTAAFAATTFTVKFNGTDGVTSSIRYSDHLAGGGENGWNGFNANTGAQQGTVIFSLPEQDWFYPVTLFKPDVSSIPAGSTITSVQFGIGNNWYNGQLWTNAEIRQIDVPGTQTWQPGNGTYQTRNSHTVNDLGAGQWFANMTTNDNGIDWAGNATDKYTARGNWGSPASYANTAAAAMTTLLASGALDGSAALNTFEGPALTQLVQNWVNGTTVNEGIALSALNATAVVGSGANLFSMAPDGAGLIITYDAVPEPAAISLLGLAFLPLLRRRSR